MKHTHNSCLYSTHVRRGFTNLQQHTQRQETSKYTGQHTKYNLVDHFGKEIFEAGHEKAVMMLILGILLKANSFTSSQDTDAIIILKRDSE